jgi:hypothetical protein
MTSGKQNDLNATLCKVTRDVETPAVQQHATPNVHACTNRRARWFVASSGMPTTLQMARSRWLVRQVYPAMPASRRLGHTSAPDSATKTLPPMCPRRPLPPHHVRGYAATPHARRAPRVHAPSRRSAPIYLPLATRRAAASAPAASERRSRVATSK